MFLIQYLTFGNFKPTKSWISLREELIIKNYLYVGLEKSHIFQI